MMKKMLPILFTLILVITITGCGSKKEKQSNNQNQEQILHQRGAEQDLSRGSDGQHHQYQKLRGD